MSTIRVAMLAQGYTAITDAPVCGNCAHRVVRSGKERLERSCGIGGFFVAVAGTCKRHTPLDPPKAEVSGVASGVTNGVAS